MSTYYAEFLAFATVHVLSLISPGPDFMMVLKTSLTLSRRSGMLVALGIACGEMVHVTYTVLGLGVVIHESQPLMTLLHYVGGAYLVYIGFKNIRAKPQKPAASIGGAECLELSQFQAIRAGFLTNVLNAKAAFFTISCFAALVSSQTPLFVRSMYGVFIGLSTLAWFAIVVLCLTHRPVQNRFVSFKHWIERFCGIFLLAFGVQMALSPLFPTP